MELACVNSVAARAEKSIADAICIDMTPHWEDFQNWWLINASPDLPDKFKVRRDCNRDVMPSRNTPIAGVLLTN